MKRLMKLTMELVVLAGVCAVMAQAKVVGTNTPANPLTEARIRKEVPVAEQKAWLDYLAKSQKQLAADKAALAAELKAAGLKTPTMPKQGASARSIPVDKDAAWYGTADARKIADTIVSFQIANGGWSKNLDMTQPARAAGEFWAADDLNRHPSAGDYDEPMNPHWNYVGTLDNDATNTELEYLRRVGAAVAGAAGEKYRASYLRGVEYLLTAQYPNGGWPQVWPLQGGYHDAITINDGAVVESLESLWEVARGEVQFAPKELRIRASEAFVRGLMCLLKMQIVVDGKLTVWAQQHDELTLAPVSARNYEMPALVSGESADALEFLMGLPDPTQPVRDAVEAGVAWFQQTAIQGYTWGGTRAEGRRLTKTDGAGPIWARYYSLTTGQPIFGDRDKTIHDDVMEISPERRNGYAWYNADGVEMLKKYAEWKKKPIL
jgi:PelA/Pel-15E family pectate lyase